MNDAPRDLRSDLRARLDIVVNRFADTVSQYTKKKEELEGEYTTTLAGLQTERMALEQLLAIEEKRCGGLGTNTAAGKTAKLVALDALDKVFAGLTVAAVHLALQRLEKTQPIFVLSPRLTEWSGRAPAPPRLPWSTRTLLSD